MNYGKIGLDQISDREKLYSMSESYIKYRIARLSGKKAKRPTTLKKIRSLQTKINKARSTLGLGKINAIDTIRAIIKERESSD